MLHAREHTHHRTAERSREVPRETCGLMFSWNRACECCSEDSATEAQYERETGSSARARGGELGSGIRLQCHIEYWSATGKCLDLGGDDNKRSQEGVHSLLNNKSP